MHPCSGNAIPVWLFLKESGIPFEAVEVDLMKGEQFSPDYTSMNPCHHVPTLKDGDVVVFESGAILRYLANRYDVGDHWYPPCPIGRARVDMALDWRQTELVGAIKPLWLTYMGFGTADWGNIESSKQLTLEKFRQLENFWLKDGRAFILGEHPSIADLSIAPVINYCTISDMTIPEGTKAYWDRFCARFPSFVEMLNAPDRMNMNRLIGMKKQTPPPTPFALVDAANRVFEEKFNTKDSAGVGNLYCKLGSVAPPGADGKVFHGREEITAFWQSAMDGGLTDLKLTTGEVHGWGDHFVETSAYSHSAGKGNYCVVWQHEDGQWKLFKDIFNV